ncbi:MAG: hypothetical protein WA474_07520 [Candidatus Sulfotelmatobacter sp.]
MQLADANYCLEAKTVTGCPYLLRGAADPPVCVLESGPTVFFFTNFFAASARFRS